MLDMYGVHLLCGGIDNDRLEEILCSLNVYTKQRETVGGVSCTKKNAVQTSSTNSAIVTLKSES